MSAEQEGGVTLSLVLNEEQSMLFETAKQFVTNNAPVARLRKLRDPSHTEGFSKGLWSQMAELGWLGLQIPEAHDGLELGFFDLCTVLEATGRELMPEPLVSTLLLGAQAFLIAGKDAQKTKWLPKVADGSAFITLANAEDTATLSVDESNGSFGFNGACLQVPDAHVADLFIIAAPTSAGTTLFAIDAKDNGLSVERQSRVDLQQVGVLSLMNVRVSADAIVGELGKGDELLDSVLDRARIGMAAQALGASERAFELTLDYLKQREQFGSLIGSFQALQHRAARLYMALAQTRSAVLAAARSVDVAPEQTPKLAALAKGIASETALAVAKEAIQMHGGIGVTDEHDIGFYLKRAQATAVAFGNITQQRKRWAELNGY